jgi:hypothetical protein
MPYPSVEQFKAALLLQPLEAVVREYVFQGSPFVFRDQPEAMDLLRNHLAEELNLALENTIVVGSAKVGFSLSPDNFPRQFSDGSDIDILVVDHVLFDRLWFTLIRWNYPRRFQLGGADWEWAKRRRGDLYWGWLVPDRIPFHGLSFPQVLRPVRDLSTKWFNAFRALSRYPEFASRNVSGRLYHTWDHALLYHMEGLRQIAERIRGAEGG